MKGAVLSILTSGVAAQIITIAPAIAPGILNVAAVNPGDPGYQTCSQAINLFEDCVSSLGGVEAAANADPTELLGCACCDGSSPAAPLYSVCSNYLEEELPTASEQYEAYGTLYKACALGASCGGGSGGSATRSPRTTAVVSDDDNESATVTSPAEQTYALACQNMLGVFASCTRANRDFTELPFKEQAECYCCRGSGDRLTWTDEMGGYAKTCASWASTGEPDTILGVAETFASFCKRYTTACDVAATRTQDSETTATDDDNDNDETDSTTESSPRQTSNSDDGNDDDNSDATTSENGPVTVTVQPTDTAAAATSTSGNAASSLRVGLGAVLAAVAALAVAL
ncbi:hypothetical protein FSOLCH5_002710 [Fusarium solani]|jgi:hypothetical protein|uniref:Uncharacterized protein n=1 Tax=Fusarium solani TaxID=169388 RepID=A0A9P9HKZ0_FUSSL|nr:uncharacterized protein B0J15DRAFT_493744 [Fusarium solani]KAH7258369.1 hypothetical protein B0J15DRAFT_493744 [Fusarium solani]KAJ3461552.1 hypothetical protein MRS44_010105 [Fusarium solani]KAJ4212503.1 hypothetical protein NW759_011541 [Fusarium solani]